MPPVKPPEEALIRVRVGMEQAHYAGDIVDGAWVLELFGDVATELLIRRDGDEGLLRAYEDVEFLAPVETGDYIEASGRIADVGNTSRTMEFEARKPIELVGDPEQPSRGRVLEDPEIVARARGICVVPEEYQ